MSIGATRDALSRIFYQRCFWLFVVLLALIGAVSFVPANDHGRLVLNGVTMFLLIATVAAVGRTTLSLSLRCYSPFPQCGSSISASGTTATATWQARGYSAPRSISSPPRIYFATSSSPGS